MGKTIVTKEDVPEDDFFNDVLDTNAEKVKEATQKGIDSGVSQGIREGMKQGMKPLAEQAGKKAIKELMGGGNVVGNTIAELSEIAKLRALENYVGSMNNNAPNTQQTNYQQPKSNPLQEFMANIAEMGKMGIDTSKIMENMDMEKLIFMANPQFAPMMMMNKRKDNDNQNKGGDSNMMGMMMAMMNNRQQQQAPPPPQQNNNELLIAMMNQQQQLQTQMFQAQQEANESRQQMLIQQMQPFLQPAPTFAEQMGDAMEKFEMFKSINGGGNSSAQSDAQINLELQRYKMSSELEREKLQIEKEIRLKQEALSQKQQEMDMVGNALSTFSNIAKNFNLESLAKPKIPQTTPEQQEIRDNIPKNPITPPSADITNRINEMLRGKKPNMK